MLEYQGYNTVFFSEDVRGNLYGVSERFIPHVRKGEMSLLQLPSGQLQLCGTRKAPVSMQEQGLEVQAYRQSSGKAPEALPDKDA